MARRAPPRAAAAFTPARLAARLRSLQPQFPRLAVCVAFSGGADSTALLVALAPLRARGLSVRAVHIDHGLQPRSRAWSAHCRRLAGALGIDLTVRRIRVPRRRGESPEAAARAARYAALAALLRPGEVLLTAHQEDDQLETFLLQLLRGAGVAGLAAMPAVTRFAQGVQVRPLLEVPAAALREYLRAQNIAWVEDDSNADERFDRNYLRAQVLPRLRGRWPGAARTVARSARHLAEAQQLLDALGAADAALAQAGAALSARALRRLPAARRANALRYWISRAGAPAPPAARLAEIAGALLSARADTHPQVAYGAWRVQRQAQLLHLLPALVADAAQRPTRLTWRWQAQPRLPWPGGGVLSLEADPRGPLDLGALGAVLSVRARGGGERLRPRLGGPRRLLKGLLQEARVPVQERAQLPLIFRGTRLVAVADRWLDASVQASARTRRRGRLRYAAPG
jgi:tRNA(Ile)-lysidine synthase